MSEQEEPAVRRYAVVTSVDGYYSIWPEGRDVPDGWELEGATGTEEECIAHVDRVWTGLDPQALRARRG
jgi:MbtH protein